MSAYPTREVVRQRAEALIRQPIEVPSAVTEARQRGDAEEAAALVFAAALADRAVDAYVVEPLLAEVDDISLFPVLLGACGGDRVTMLLDAVERGRMSEEREVLALFLAVELLGGAAPPQRLCGLLRIHARRRLGLESSIILALAVRKLGDKDTLVVAKTWIGMADVVEAPALQESLLNALHAPLLRALPERPPERVISGFTVRRAAPRVGRNDPCSCGSGRKYKKCCLEKDAQRAADPSPHPGLTREELLRSRGELLTRADIDTLRPQELPTLDVTRLQTLPLLQVLQRATAFHCWPVAESALAALADRADLPSDSTIDDYRSDLIGAAIQADQLEVQEVQAVIDRQLRLLRDPAVMNLADRLTLELRRPEAKAPLRALEEAALTGLRNEDGEALLDVSFALLDVAPALGILAARASLNAKRALDMMVLLETVEEARDRLNLPPGDGAREVYDHLLEQDVSRRVEDLGRRAQDARQEQLAAEAESLRGQLQRSRSRVQELERSLSTQEALLSKLSASVPAPLPPTAGHAAEVSAAAEEARRLRGKLARMKQVLKEHTEERAALRKRLAEAHDALVVAPTAAELPASEAEEEEEGAPIAPPRGLLVPTFLPPAQEALRAVPAATARKALLLAAALASGEDAAWRQAKRMVATQHTLSCRIGLHHRLLFTIQEHELQVLTLIHRKDLDHTLKRYL